MGLGDEVMVTGHVREMYRKDPRKVRVQYERNRWHEIWDNNPKIAQQGEQGYFQTFWPRENYLRPYCSEKTGKRWTWKAYTPLKGEIYLTDEELKVREGVTIVEPHLKPGASPNKQWGWEKWQRLADLLLKAGHKVVQIGQANIKSLSGVEYIETPTVRNAAALVSKARLVVVPEGGLHHVAAAFDTPAAVIFGGYIAPEVTGYKDQINFFEGGWLGCGWRIPCRHCTDAMAKITPERVMERL